MISSLLFPSCARMVSLRVNQTFETGKKATRYHRDSTSYILGIDEDDEQKEEDKERISLLEVRIPQGLGNFRKAVAGKQTAQLGGETNKCTVQRWFHMH